MGDAEKHLRLLRERTSGLEWLFRLARDLLLIGFWTVLVTIVFLATGWPRWTFYTLLLAGIVLYVRLTGR